MLGQMMQRPLLISDILTYGAEMHPNGEIVSVRTEGDIHRQTYAETALRVAKLGNALRARGVKIGDRVATLAWNGYRHFELYYAISGIGAICHTINPRLSAEQMIYIVNHAEDKIIFVDTTFVPILNALKDHLPADLTYVVMTDRAHMPDNALNALCYEELLDEQPDTIDWPEFDENTAAGLCYTSGTTGHPKGALYSNRSTVLHALYVAMALGVSLPQEARILPVVPLFHVNAWGIPYASAMCGAKLVLPGLKLDGQSLYDLARAEGCTLSLGVPTVWIGLFKYLDEAGIDPATLPFERVLIGGSAAPRALLRRFHEAGVHAFQAWGMSETSPVATVATLLPHQQALGLDGKLDVLTRQGRAMFGVELKIVGEDGQELPQDGSASGELKVRGPWVTSGYYGGVGGQVLDADGWFATGDVARIDTEGFVTLTDRAKDVIKSGGEWISSIDLENAALGHPAVEAAAVIGVYHEKWQERPLMLVVRKRDTAPEPAEIRAVLEDKVAHWWLPDAIVFVDSLPLTATGKLDKKAMRAVWKDYLATA